MQPWERRAPSPREENGGVGGRGLLWETGDGGEMVAVEGGSCPRERGCLLGGVVGGDPGGAQSGLGERPV